MIHKIWLFFNIAIFIWAIGAISASLISSNLELSKLSWKIGCGLGVNFTAPTILHLACEITKRKMKRILIFSYIIIIILSSLILFSNSIFDISSVKFHSFFLKSPKLPYLFWFIVWFSIAAYAQIILLQYLFKESKGNNELKIFTIATSIAFTLGGLDFLSIFRLPIFEYGNFGLSIYCLLVTYIIFRHQFLGINIVIQKGLFYSLLIAVFTGLYLILILVTELIFKSLIGYKSVFLSLSSAFIIAILFNPIRNKIQKLTDQIFLGKTSEEFAQENKLLHQELERSQRLKAASTLALGLAHEIKNPLTTIKTFAEFLPEKFQDKDFVGKFSKLVPMEVERINNIVHQLLDFSKPAPPSFRNTNIHQLIKDILVFLSNDFLKKKIKVVETYADSTFIINIDPIQIKQALLNIILNGIEAMPQGGVLSISTVINQDCFEIEISDTGTGIDVKDISHIFDPFFSTKDKGTGLGLSITHQIIKNHGGMIEVKSIKGVETNFTIKLKRIIELNPSEY